MLYSQLIHLYYLNILLYILFHSFHRILNMVLRSRTLLLIHSLHNSLHLLTPNSQSFPLLPPPLSSFNSSILFSQSLYAAEVGKSKRLFLWTDNEGQHLPVPGFGESGQGSWAAFCCDKLFAGTPKGDPFLPSSPSRCPSLLPGMGTWQC